MFFGLNKKGACKSLIVREKDLQFWFCEKYTILPIFRRERVNKFNFYAFLYLIQLLWHLSTWRQDVDESLHNVIAIRRCKPWCNKNFPVHGISSVWSTTAGMYLLKENNNNQQQQQKLILLLSIWFQLAYFIPNK